MGEDQRREGPPPWVTTEPRSAMNPYPIRMFTEEGGIVLWGPLDEPPPTTSGADSAYLEDLLPLSADLRDRLLTWAREGGLMHPAHDRDEQGFHLSRELQRELGDLYTVSFSFEFAGSHQQALRGLARDEPLPGWSLR